MERLTEFTPAFDRRDPDPDKNYGIHGVELRMVLKGELGAVQFVLFTNWMLPHVEEECKKNPKSISYIEKYPFTYVQKPMPADVGYHSPKPIYDDQLPTGVRHTHDEDYNVTGTEGEAIPCPYLDGKPCYYDGSSLAAEEVYKILLAEGSEGVWKHLEERYENTFGELK